MHLVYPPQFRITIAFDFSWDDSNTQGKLEIMVMHNFSGGGGGDKVHYGLRKNSEGKVTVEWVAFDTGTWLVPSRL